MYLWCICQGEYHAHSQGLELWPPGVGTAPWNIIPESCGVGIDLDLDLASLSLLLESFEVDPKSLSGLSSQSNSSISELGSMSYISSAES